MLGCIEAVLVYVGSKFACVFIFQRSELVFSKSYLFTRINGPWHFIHMIMRCAKLKAFHPRFVFVFATQRYAAFSFLPLSARYKKKNMCILTWWREQPIRAIPPAIHKETFSKTLILVLNTTWWALWNDTFKFLIAQTMCPKVPTYWSFPSDSIIYEIILRWNGLDRIISDRNNFSSILASVCRFSKKFRSESDHRIASAKYM
jgi:hypothetical protein